jgi:hypothetical protein
MHDKPTHDYNLVLFVFGSCSLSVVNLNINLGIQSRTFSNQSFGEPIMAYTKPKKKLNLLQFILPVKP